MQICQEQHRYDQFFSTLPLDQGEFGRHKCAGCAYQCGYEAGLQRKTILNIAEEVEKVPYSQAGEVRHRSPIAAFSKGYNDGLQESYRREQNKN